MGGIDVLDEGALQATGIVLEDRLHAAADELVDRVSTGVVDRAATEASNVLGGVMNSLAATESKAAVDAHALVASLNGWTAEITLGGVIGWLFGTIRIVLKAPQK